MVWKELNAKEIEFVLDTNNRIWNERIPADLLHCFSTECQQPLRLFYERKGNLNADRYRVVGTCPNCKRIHGFGGWRIPRGIVDPDRMKALINFGA